MPRPDSASRQVTFREAIGTALLDSMSEDPSTIFMGLGATDAGRVFNTTQGLLETFGADRVFDGPTSENAMTGVGVGAALGGLRPIMSHQRLDFFLLAMDQLVNSAAKWHYMFGGAVTVPITIRLVLGRGWGQGPTHSQNLQAWFAHIPGLKVVVPTLTKDAYGMLRASISDPNPVLFLEHRWLHQTAGDLTPDKLTVRIDKSRICRIGEDISICASGLGTLEALRAAEWLEAHNVDCEVIDLRTLNPIDWTTILDSASKTRRVLALDAAPITGSIAGELVARVSTELFSRLIAPPIRLAQPDVPEPTSHALTKGFHVDASAIARAVMASVGRPMPKGIEALNPNSPHDVPGPWFAGPF